jgi:NTE family protein
MIALLRQVVDPGTSEGALWAGMRIHRIASEELNALSASSKLLAEWSFFCKLRDLGRAAAEDFLVAHAHDLGSRSTYDLDALLAKV